MSSKFRVLAFVFQTLLATVIMLNEGVLCGSASDQIVILISFDGFRYDYLDKYKEVVPELRKLASDGVRADFVRNVYPTVTFPNHYTLVTGLYSENHGIVANNMYDPVFNATFTMRTNESRWWQEGDPIWVTSERQNKKSGVMYWPGYDAVIRKRQPTYRPLNTKYSGQPFADTKNVMPWEERIDLAIKWLNGTDPPSVVLLYFNEPDEEGHEFGTDSIQMRNILKQLDGNTTYLMEKLKLLDCFDRINLIFTADHGMINFNTSMTFDVHKYVDPESYVLWTHNGLMLLLTNSSKSSLEELYQNWKVAENETRAFNVYKKEEIPEYFHYRNNRRIADLLVVVKPYHVLNLTVHYITKKLPNHTYGAHGYSPLVPEMHQYLVAYGPAFKKGYRSGPLYEVDLYSLMCHILDITPTHNDGDLNRINHILKSSNWVMNALKSHKTLVLGIACPIVVLFFVALFVLIARRCRSKDHHGVIHFTNRRKDNLNESHALMDTDEEDDIVIM